MLLGRRLVKYYPKCCDPGREAFVLKSFMEVQDSVLFRLWVSTSRWREVLPNLWCDIASRCESGGANVESATDNAPGSATTYCEPESQ
jgi:hypothetical protein